MNQISHNTIVLQAVRWRFLVNTIWFSLTSGFLIYVLTLVLNIPYGWAVFLLVLRAVFWAYFIDIRKLDVTMSEDKITGPSIFFTSAPQTVVTSQILVDQIFEWFGAVFSIEDSNKNEIMGCYAWYAPEDRQSIRKFVKGLKRIRKSRQ